MTSPRYLLSNLTLLLTVLTPSYLYAASTPTLHKFIGAELGYGTFSFDKKIDQNLVFPVASLTTGLAYQRISVVLNVSSSLSDAEVSEEGEYGDASRKDFDLTAGYQLHKFISIFAGYKRGQTDLSLTSRTSTVTLGDEYYKQYGPYLGINLNWAIPEAGKLAFSVAYADLDAENKFSGDGDGVEAGEELEFDDINGKSEGKSTGYSYSLGWSMPIKGSFIFRTRLKINRYEQDITYEGAHFKGIEEDTTMLLVGVTSVF